MSLERVIVWSLGPLERVGRGHRERERERDFYIDTYLFI